MSQRTEYRVCWKREGRRRSTAIYQSWISAHRKARGILALEEIKEDSRFHSMPDLEGPPVIETRQVGPWEAGDFQVTEASEFVKASMADWARYTDRKGESVSGPF